MEEERGYECGHARGSDGKSEGIKEGDRIEWNVSGRGKCCNTEHLTHSLAHNCEIRKIEEGEMQGSEKTMERHEWKRKIRDKHGWKRKETARCERNSKGKREA